MYGYASNTHGSTFKVYVIHHINKVKKNNSMIISIDIKMHLSPASDGLVFEH